MSNQGIRTGCLVTRTNSHRHKSKVHTTYEVYLFIYLIIWWAKPIAIATPQRFQPLLIARSSWTSKITYLIGYLTLGGAQSSMIDRVAFFTSDTGSVELYTLIAVFLRHYT